MKNTVEESWLLDSWARYFVKPATPQNTSEYTDNYNNDVTFQNNFI